MRQDNAVKELKRLLKQDPFLTNKEAAEALNLSQNYIYWLCSKEGIQLRRSRRKNKPDKKRESLVLSVKEDCKKMTRKEIAIKYNMTLAAIDKIIYRNGFTPKYVYKGKKHRRFYRKAAKPSKTNILNKIKDFFKND